MGKQDRYTKYSCDRDNCGTEEYLVAGDAKEKDWTQISRITADGNPISRYLCSSCQKRYKSLAHEQDAAFNAFMSGGE